MTEEPLQPLYSIEAEEALIAAVLTDAEILDHTSYLNKDDFYDTKTQYIWRSIKYLLNNRKHIDTISIIESLKNNDLLEKSGGSYYITGLFDTIPTTTNAGEHAKVIREYAIKRRLQEVSCKFYQSGIPDLNGDLTKFQQEIDEITSSIPQSTTIPGLTLHTYSDYIDDATPEPDFIITSGILPERGVLIIGGQPKAGKSILSINLGYCLATASNWLGFTIPQKRRTLILQAENSYYNVRRRIKTLHNASEPPYCFDIPKDDNLIMSDPVSIKINEFNGYTAVRQLIKQYKPEVLILDPLIHFHSAGENDNAEMGMVMEQIRSLANNHDLAIVLVHHTKKPGMDSSPGGMALRGASAVFGAVDSSLVLARNSDPDTGDTSYALNFDIRNGENPEQYTLDFDETILFFMKKDSDSINIGQFIQDTLIKCGFDGISRKLLIELAEDEGFANTTTRRKLTALINKETVRTDGKKRDQIMYYHTFYNGLEIH